MPQPEHTVPRHHEVSSSGLQRAAPAPRLVVEDDGTEQICRLDGAELMAPFLMSLPSATDHWLFASSSGGLTAGRVEPSRALFPYETEDRLHRTHGVSGPMTLIRAHSADGSSSLWEPFDDRQLGPGRRRTLRKSALGAWLELEEVDAHLGLRFRARWSTSEVFGFVRTVELTRLPGSEVATAEVLDGLLDILPDGVPLALQQKASCLADAYKRSELVPESGLAIYSLEAQISDRPAPAESLRANVVWALGPSGASLGVCAEDVRAFREGRPLGRRARVTGERGAFLLHARFDLRTQPSPKWRIIADVHLGHVELEAFAVMARRGAELESLIDADIARGVESLRRLVALGDGLERTGDATADVHHLANVLYNEMRGGVFESGYRVTPDEVSALLTRRNRPARERHAAWLAGLAGLAGLEHRALVASATRTGDPQLARLCSELLPLSFSRTHGDPSRPWNHFAIRVKDTNGQRLVAYQGNWRDIFQNWEALCQSFPGYLESVIAKFVNASTLDGFNPYRVTSEGIDWERPDPADPWGNIGYWGDHQIVYLTRLLEASARSHPGALAALLRQRLFSYADVPYRILPYADLLRDAKDTLVYDRESAARVEERVGRVGTDGRLVHTADGEVLLVSLAEKLLVPALSKLSNLVADGGIWLNTQRPEWNDANNALVGSGLSVVTLAHLRRYLAHLSGLFAADEPLSVSGEVATWLRRVSAALREHTGYLGTPRATPKATRALLDTLGLAFSDYRREVYASGLSGPVELAPAEVRDLCAVALAHVDHGLSANRRSDGLYHAYNLLRLSADEAGVEPLYEMLEGQVALLSSGFLSAEGAIELIDALFRSRLYRADQDSFMLYPARELPSFLEKNRVPVTAVAQNPLLAALLAGGDTSVVARDAAGQLRFQPDLGGAPALAERLRELAKNDVYRPLVERHGAATQEVYESVFHHHAFTGRSGTMHKYEGLGCIYWHMVAKLLVATQEVLFEAIDGGAAETTVRALAQAYGRIRAGLLCHKSAAVSGVFSTDPYSHTPLHAGAQQPGMTGLVKEELLVRPGELGARVKGGRIAFTPVLLRRSELLTAAAQLSTYDAEGRPYVLSLPAGSLCFSLCRVPFVLRASDGPWQITVTERSGSRRTLHGQELDAEASASLLDGGGLVVRVDVEVPRSCFQDD
jgi:hypothetical protein